MTFNSYYGQPCILFSNWSNLIRSFNVCLDSTTWTGVRMCFRMLFQLVWPVTPIETVEVERKPMPEHDVPFGCVSPSWHDNCECRMLFKIIWSLAIAEQTVILTQCIQNQPVCSCMAVMYLRIDGGRKIRIEHVNEHPVLKWLGSNSHAMAHGCHVCFSH